LTTVRIVGTSNAFAVLASAVTFLMIDQKKNAIVGRQKSFEAHLLII